MKKSLLLAFSFYLLGLLSYHVYVQKQIREVNQYYQSKETLFKDMLTASNQTVYPLADVNRELVGCIRNNNCDEDTVNNYSDLTKGFEEEYKSAMTTYSNYQY